MKIKEVIDILEELAPLSYTEKFDNTGLIVGNYERKMSAVGGGVPGHNQKGGWTDGHLHSTHC